MRGSRTHVPPTAWRASQALPEPEVILIMNKARLLLTVFLVISCFSDMSFTARAQAPAEFSGRLCVTMPEMQAFQEAFKADAELLRKMAADNATINVVSTGDRYRLSSRNPVLSRTLLAKATPAASPCAASPAEETIKTIGSINAAYIASFDVVTSYRQNHQPWPLGAINSDPSRVDVVGVRYGQYVIISLADSYSHRDAAGNATLGCGGVEYYRIDLRQAIALPFDGCIEGHQRGLLPALSQLPQSGPTQPRK